MSHISLSDTYNYFFPQPVIYTNAWVVEIRHRHIPELDRSLCEWPPQSPMSINNSTLAKSIRNPFIKNKKRFLDSESYNFWWKLWHHLSENRKCIPRSENHWKLIVIAVFQSFSVSSDLQIGKNLKILYSILETWKNF